MSDLPDDLPYDVGARTRHVAPQRDWIGHDEAGLDGWCVCGPRVEIVQCADGAAGSLIVHQALDPDLNR